MNQIQSEASMEFLPYCSNTFGLINLGSLDSTYKFN